MFLVITGPSGAGKSTLINILLQDSLFKLSVSATTRPPRPGEVNGEQYEFISEAEFKKRIAENAFLEYTTFKKNMYGTPRLQIHDNEHITIYDVDLNGAGFFLERQHNSELGAWFTCLIISSKQVLKRRINQRAGTKHDGEAAERAESFEMYNSIDLDLFDMVIDNNGPISKLHTKAQELKNEVLEKFQGWVIKNKNKENIN